MNYDINNIFVDVAKNVEQMPFTVTVTETLQREVSVNANSLEEARDIVELMYNNSEIILDAEDLVDRSFVVSEDFSVVNKGKSR